MIYVIPCHHPLYAFCLVKSLENSMCSLECLFTIVKYYRFVQKYDIIQENILFN